MAKSKKSRKKSFFTDLHWTPFFIVFAVFFVFGFYLTINYFFEMSSYDHAMLEYNTDIVFYTVADVLSMNYSHGSQIPAEPSFPFYGIGFMVLGAVGFVATKFYYMNADKRCDNGKVKRT